MGILIKNNIFKTEIEEKGAELISLFHLPTKCEYIWQRDKNIWSNSAPILFPIVGRLKEGGYYHNGKRYDMDIHGFAKDNKFEILLKTQNNLVLHLEDNEFTRKQYPFSFSLDVFFSLLKNRLDITYNVKNKGQDRMYFSIGSHPGFNLLPENGSIENYYIEFEKKENFIRYEIKEGLLEDLGKPYSNDKKRIFLNEEIFKDDALIFKRISSKKIYLKNLKTKYNIEIDTGGAPSLGIWSKPNASYVCIEPWYGYDDSHSSSGRLEEKEGIISLLPLKTFKTHYSIKVNT